MQLRKGHSELTVMDAVDNLSHMAELDIPMQEIEGKRDFLSEEQASQRMETLSWHDPEYRTFNQERIKETFQTILKYIKGISEREKGFLREEQTQRGIQAMMILVAEAAKKVDNYTEIFKGDKTASATELKEYKELQHFYLTKVVQRFNPLSDLEEKWRDSWGSGEIQNVEQAALKDLETVRKDREYELFLIRNEDNTPYFNRALLYHMQLVGQFDSLLADPSLEDPFLQIEIITDRDANTTAKEILKSAAPYIDEFFKDAMKFKNIPFVSAISKSLMALMMAGNSRNLMQNAIGKHAFNYYSDFHLYLRSALSTPEYRKFITKPSAKSESFIQTVIHLSHVLCTSFFMKVGVRKDMIELIHSLIEKGSKGTVVQRQTASPLTFWNNLLDKDGSIRSLFKQYPNGPLLKTIKLFNNENEMKGFDPIMQHNYPGQLYAISGENMHISCLRLPCPISQTHTAKASVIEEFEGFLRSLGSPKRSQRHLLINMQDRTSWQEHSRSITIENVQKTSEFINTLMVVTLPKNTDFYLQSGTYLEWDDASGFMKQLREEVASGEQCGFYFPPEVDKEKLLQFADKAKKVIHEVFFGGKGRLTHKNRLDFIEIFYLMLTLKLIEEFKPDSFSYTCKDAVDTGAVASVELFALLRLMNDSARFSKEEENFLLWMLYAPAMMNRERAVDMQRFNRMEGALTVINAELEAHRDKTVEACSKLYKLPFFKGISVKESS